MRSYFLIFLTFSISICSLAQDDDYSFMSDKKFQSPQDLIGYNFVPNELEIPREGSEELGPGEYSFGISANNLYVAGQDIKGVYNINSINSTEYGFKLALINARDPRQQGHLKIIQTGPGYVDALVFKKSTDHSELIFYLPQMPDDLRQADKDYFTDRSEIELLEVDSIWGMHLHPFFRIYSQGSVHERLQMEDSTSIAFVEEIEIIEKVKKPKKEKSPKKKKKKKGEFNIETGMYEGEEMEQDSSYMEEKLEPTMLEMDSLSLDTLANLPEIKTKIIRKYYIDVTTTIVNDDDTTELQKKRYVIKGIKEREDEFAEGMTERFQIELTTNKGLIYLYLTSNRTISSFEVFDERYLMRGH